jgi:hypothetical protein
LAIQQLLNAFSTTPEGAFSLSTALKQHLHAFLMAYNLAKRLKTLKGLTPLRRAVQPALHGVDYGLMLPALDPAASFKASQM